MENKTIIDEHEIKLELQDNEWKFEKLSFKEDAITRED
jgi:hypothetical protein